MAEPTFQDVFKLMNSMASFEELLDATALKPETCVNLGIHDKFKQIYDKLGKYVQHEETTDLSFKSICNVCCNEVKILNCDIRTSVAIHNAGELHRVAAKMMEINKQDQDFGGKSVQQSIDLKNISKELFKPTGQLPSTTTAVMQVDSKERNLDFETKPVLHLLDFDHFPSESIKSSGEITNTIAANNTEMKTKTQLQLVLETKSVAPLIDLNNIPSELLKPTSNANLISQNEGFVSNNLNANVASPCTSCQQVFCICGYKDNNNTQVLNEKMSNVNLSQQGGTYCVPGNYSVPPPPLFPGGILPQGFKQPYGTTRGRNPSPQNRTSKKPQEKRSSSISTPVETNSPRQYLNVHVHMPPSGGQLPQSYTQPDTNHHQAQSKRNAHVRTIPPSVGQSPQSYTQPGAAPHHQAQTKSNVNMQMPPYGGKLGKAYTQPGTAPHQQTQTKRNVYVQMPPYGGKSAQAHTQPIAGQHHPSKPKKNTVEENLELLRSKTLEQKEEMQLMYKMLRQAEAGYWRRNHYTKVYNREQARNEYVCNVCGTGSRMNCSLHVVQHARGRSHQELLHLESRDGEGDDRDGGDGDRSECVVM